MATTTKTKMKHQTPAAVAVEAFGGVRALARALDKAPSSVSRWSKSRRRGGSAGAIPTSAISEILKVAGEKGIKLTPDDLVLGRALA